jgi:hypothetical protein
MPRVRVVNPDRRVINLSRVRGRGLGPEKYIEGKVLV